MNEFNPAQHVKIATDHVRCLRKCDVFRVLEWAPPEIPSSREEMADYILTHRPDLAQEVAEVMAELAS